MSLPRLLLMLPVVALALPAQSITGSIVGHASDPSGAAVPAIEVTLTNQQTNAVRRTATNQDGNYTFPLTPAGLYTLTSAHPAFRPVRVTGVQVDVDRATRVDVRFELGNVAESITISAQDNVRVETDTATLAQTLEQKRIVDLPISRNFMSLAALTAGVIPVTGENGQSLQTSFTNRGNLSVFVAGQRESSVSFLIDGVESRGERLGNASMPVSLDAIQQFGMLRNSMSAEYGNATAVVNVSIKSGTNQLHGTLFEFLQNSHLNARNFFDGADKAQTRFNNYGGSLGGPVFKDKTFFFVNYEGSKRRTTSPQLARLPTAAQMGGDLTTLGALIYDPAAGNPATGARAPFPNNIIPTQRIATFAKNYAAYIPLPNLATPVNNNNFRISPSSIDDTNQYHLRVDHQLRANDSIFVRWSAFDAANTRPRIHPLWGTSYPWTTYNGAIQQTHIFGPRAINEFRFGYSRDNIFQRPEQVPGKILANELGLRNTVQNEVDGGALPAANIAGFTGFGGGRPTGYISNRFQFSNTLSLTRGNHAIKIGADIRRLQYNVFSSNSPNGDISFARLFTTSTAGGQTGGDAFADFLLGAFSNASGARTVNSPAFRNSVFNFFLQDEWKATRKLHISAGLRWEYAQRPYDVHDRIAVSDFEYPGKLLFARNNPYDPNDKSLSTAVRRSLIDPDWNNFGPRFGLAYDLNGSTVLRAAYGVFFDVTQANELNFLGFVPPFQTVITLTNDPRALAPAQTTADLFPNPTGLGQLDPGTAIFSHLRTDKTPYVQQFNYSIQHRLGAYLLEASYVGSLGRKQSKRRNFNQKRINAPVPYFPLPNFGSILTSEKNSNSSYNALQLRLERQLRNGLSFLANYTFSKSIDLDSAGAAGDQNQDATNIAADRALSDFDVRHRFVASVSYALPFFEKNRILGGWQANVIGSFQRGFPLNIVAADTSGAGAFTVLRANRIAGGNLPRDQRTIERYFDTAAFLAPRPGTFGSSGRNPIIGPGINNFSLSALKNVPLRERIALQFRAEFFNAFNHAQFFAPGASVSTPASFGRISSARSPRNIQFGLKLNF
ncbi:MAG: TonB-dependent receptor [Acidobacteria bacterium]|nr:TonB-dependent receptor [Acidobacteriota bacterium]